MRKTKGLSDRLQTMADVEGCLGHKQLHGLPSSLPRSPPFYLQSIWLTTKLLFTQCQQFVRLGPHFTSTIILSTDFHQGCALSPLLYALQYNCTPTHPTNTIIKYADNTTVVGLISDGDETAYRAEVEKLSLWCSANNLVLNVHKTKGLIMYFRKHKQDHTFLFINGEKMETVTSFRFLGT